MKMKNFILIATAFLSCTFGYSQTESQERKLQTFNQLEVSGNLKIVLSQSENPSVTVTTKPEALESVITEVKEGTLYISTKKSSTGKVEVTVADIKRIKQTGNTSLISQGLIKSETLEIESSGASETNLDVDVNELSTTISGAGDVRLKGNAQNHKIKINGAGDIMAFELETQNTDATISGAGEARINAINNLDVKVSGAGDVVYLNEPAQKNIDISGAGSVRKQKGTVVDVEAKYDTTKLRFGDVRVLVIADDKKSKKDSLAPKKPKIHQRKNHWAGLDIGIAGYATGVPSLDVPSEYDFLTLNYSSSRVWNLNFYEKYFKIHKNYVGIVTGLGLEFNRYNLLGNHVIVPYADSLTAFGTGTNFRKNILTANYLTLPLLLEFNTHQNPKKSFHLATGLVGAYRFSSKTRQVSEIDGRKSRVVTSDDFNLAPFKYSATVRLGYGNTNVFASYALSQLFEKGKGPELYPFTAGITLIGF
jgi:hypothetical protein